jgi:LPS-assembly protein
MNRFPILLLGLITALSVAPAQVDLQKMADVMQRIGSDVDISSDGDTSFDTEKSTVVWKGNVRIKVQGSEIYADRAEFDTELEEIRVSSNVTIYREGLLYRGESATYSLRTSQLDVRQLKSGFEPLFFQASEFKTKTEEVSVINANDATFTTDDSDDPDWFIKAKEVRIYPNDRVVFVSPKAYVGNTPVFWLPYLAQPLDEQLGYQFTPGYKGAWGAFLQNRYGTMWGDHSIIQYNLDYRSQRGIAGGIDLLSRRWKDSETFGKFKAYYADDQDPSQTFVTGSRENRGDLDSGRYRINLQHRIYLPGPDASSLYVDFDINKVSDEFFYQDFFPGEFRLDPEPDNYVAVVKQHERGELSLNAKFRLNDFYQNDQRLPELALDATRQPIFDTGAFYWGSTSFGIYDEELAPKRRDRLKRQLESLESGGLATGSLLDSDEGVRTELDDLRSQLQPTGFSRLFSYHEALYPMQLGTAFNITPKLGVGAANYSSVDGPAPENSTRTLFSAGVDTSFKMSKMYDDVKMPALGVDGLLHVVQPYLNWSYLSADSLGDKFNRLDRLVPSTRLRPLDVPQFTAIDDLQSWNLLRIGVENRLLTRRGEGSQPWLTSNTYFNAFLEDPEFNRDFSNLFEEIVWSPLPWLRMNLAAQLPAFGGEQDFTEINTSLTFMPTDWFEFNVGHRYLQDHPYFTDSNLVDFRTYTRFSENWGLSTYHRYELDDSTFETQQYSLYRDLSSWTAGLGVVLRDNRGKNETGVVFSLTLKDFPSVSLPLDLDTNGAN